MEDCMERIAVRQLLGEDEPEEFIETIDTLYEAWICSELSDGTTSQQRTAALLHIKALKRLMNSLTPTLSEREGERTR
jgi:hypothetical protein